MSPTFTILIVDDNKKVCDLFAAFVKMGLKGVQCVFASEPAQAILKMENQNFDLIVIDKMLPNKSGLDLIKNMKNSLRYSNKKILFMSASMERVDVYRVLHMGVNDILIKPFTFKQVVAKISKLLELPQH
jgi:DNA-binding response OmpR family regulator